MSAARRTAPSPSLVPVTEQNAVVFLDIDGAFIPLSTRSRWPDAELVTTGFGAWISRTKAARLEALPARLVWLTSWGHEAADLNGVFATRHPEPCPGPRVNRDAGWWKADLIIQWLNANPGITQVVWIDDEIGEKLTPRCRRALMAAAPRARIQLAATTEELTAADLDQIEAFLAG